MLSKGEMVIATVFKEIIVYYSLQTENTHY